MKPLTVPALRTPIIHLFCGLPASGKSTGARELLAAAGGTMRRVNLDDLRAMMDPPTAEGRPLWSHAHEHTTEIIQVQAVRALVLDGYDLVIDDTNLTPNEPGRLRDAVGRLAWFVVHDLTDVTAEECIRRDAERPNSVGVDVIRNLAAQHAAARATGWQLTHEWMNENHNAAAGGARWARTYLPRAESDPAA